ncbi:MAG: hypothetical protein ACKVJG_04485 [Candidatus Latescibacterota bacterium]
MKSGRVSFPLRLDKLQKIRRPAIALARHSGVAPGIMQAPNPH